MNDLLNIFKSFLEAIIKYFLFALMLVILVLWGMSSSVYKAYKNIKLSFIAPMELPVEKKTGYFIFNINKNNNFDSDSLLSAAKKNPIILTGGVQITLETFSAESESDTGDNKTKIIGLSKKEIKQLYVPSKCISVLKEKNKINYSRISKDTEKLGMLCHSSSNHCVLTQENDNFNIKDLDKNSCENIVKIPLPLEWEPNLVKEYQINAYGDCTSNCQIGLENQIYAYKSKFLSSDLITRAFELEQLNKERIASIGSINHNDNSIQIDLSKCIDNKCEKSNNDPIIENSTNNKNDKLNYLNKAMKQCKELKDYSCALDNASKILKIDPENYEINNFKLEMENIINNINSSRDDKLSQKIFEINADPTPNPSFDCNKASIPSEKTICNSTKLSVLDNELSKIYKQIKNKSPNSEQLKHEQIQFIKNIRVCSDNEICLENNYNLRIFELKKISEIKL